MTSEPAQALLPELGPVLSRYLAAGDAKGVDREVTKALIGEAIATAPGSASLLEKRAEAFEGDTTLDEAVARAREEADLREALARDPDYVEARVRLASLLVRGNRLDDADLLLSAQHPKAAARPAALEVRAQAAESRGLSERAEALVLQAGEFATCGAVELGLSLAERRHEMTRAEALGRLRSRCTAAVSAWRDFYEDEGTRKVRSMSSARSSRWSRGIPNRSWPGLSLSMQRATRRGRSPAVDGLVAIWPRSALLGRAWGIFWSSRGTEKEREARAVRRSSSMDRI